jgi:hypothetical protein
LNGVDAKLIKIGDERFTKGFNFRKCVQAYKLLNFFFIVHTLNAINPHYIRYFA